MTGRLILINKVHPMTPTINDARPITALSPIRKFMELHLERKLKDYLLEKINKS